MVYLYPRISSSKKPLLDLALPPRAVIFCPSSLLLSFFLGYNFCTGPHLVGTRATITATLCNFQSSLKPEGLGPIHQPTTPPLLQPRRAKERKKKLKEKNPSRLTERREGGKKKKGKESVPLWKTDEQPLDFVLVPHPLSCFRAPRAPMTGHGDRNLHHAHRARPERRLSSRAELDHGQN